MNRQKVRFILSITTTALVFLISGARVLPASAHPSAPEEMIDFPLRPEGAPLQDITVLTAGFEHTCALTGDGGVWCWGRNDYGQLGDGSTTDRINPVPVIGLSSGIIDLSGGDFYSCALFGSGEVRCWGYNGSGQLGDGTQTNRLIPAPVVGLSSDIIGLTAGGYHTCALTGSGGIWCWGNNTLGQLGDGTFIGHRLTPVEVVDLSGGVNAIEAGTYHTCALVSGGGVKCWGYGGAVGDGSGVDRSRPVNVNGLSSGVTVIASGVYHSCAVASGGVKCWGDGFELSPVGVPGLNNVTALAAGYGQTCSVSGGVQCWGRNESGKLGDGTFVTRSTPVVVEGLSSGATSLAAGWWHTCAVIEGGGAKCWGDNKRGQLGSGMLPYWTTPVKVNGLNSPALLVTAGSNHTCAIIGGGKVKCWGANEWGQLGNGSATTAHLSPVEVSGLNNAGIVAAGGLHTCALSGGGGGRCWGYNLAGALGNGTITSSFTPVQVSGLSSGIVDLTTGVWHTCALISGGGVKCWGNSQAGQVGDGVTSTIRLLPVQVTGLSSGVTGLAAGLLHTCVVISGGKAKCWGDNTFGQLGDGTTTGRLSPTDVAGLTGGVKRLVTGYFHTCALRSGGNVRCWGHNDFGQVGDGTTTTRLSSVPVSGLDEGVIGLTAGWDHTCALLSGGSVKCWGRNYAGQIGDGTTKDRLTPVEVSGLSSGVIGLEAGEAHTCALLSGGELRCWGNNRFGQLGDGHAGYSPTPVEVLMVLPVHLPGLVRP